MLRFALSILPCVIFAACSTRVHVITVAGRTFNYALLLTIELMSITADFTSAKRPPDCVPNTVTMSNCIGPRANHLKNLNLLNNQKMHQTSLNKPYDGITCTHVLPINGDRSLVPTDNKHLSEKIVRLHQQLKSGASSALSAQRSTFNVRHLLNIAFSSCLARAATDRNGDSLASREAGLNLLAHCIR
ncbi:hypothetical protein BDR06DRAFT_144956 [Suillus hirtellus]|nr:hypothetical protein BDR06DRAFT_144956 [Suillus hirtellus]